MSRRAVVLLMTAVAIVAGGAAYTAGVSAGRAAPVAATAHPLNAQTVQAPQPDQFPFLAPGQPQMPGQAPAPGQVPGQVPAPGQVPPLREFIPLPGQGDQNPGQRQQNPQGECEPIILFYKDGQLFQLRPGPGPRDGQGRPGTPPEFYFLNPYQGPPIPGFPFPRQDRGPGFSPINPRS